MRKKSIIIAASSSVVVGLIAIGIIVVFRHNNQETTNQSTSEQSYDSTQTIVLDHETTNLILSEQGSYHLTGSFNHAVIIDAPNSEVELILDNVIINSAGSAAIIGRNADQIKITLASDSYNELRDGDGSEYDGCIFSNAELVFAGDGVLTVHGQQTEGEGIATEAQNLTFESGTYYIYANDDGINAGGDGATITINGGAFYIDASGDGIDSNKDAIINGGTIFVMGSDIGGDAGIDTDDGFTINGGTVIALGSDMLETPLTDSEQNSLAITLGRSIEAGEIVSLWRNNDTEVISFVADKSFQTLLVSLSSLTEGNYQLYTGGVHDGEVEGGIYQNGNYTKGTKFTLDNITEFAVTDGVNEYGRSNFGPGSAPGGPAGSNRERPPERPMQ